MRLHRNVRVQVVECAVCLLAAIPAALIHTLDFFISTTRTLMLLGARNWNKAVNLIVTQLANHTRLQQFREHGGRMGRVTAAYLVLTRLRSSRRRLREHVMIRRDRCGVATVTGPVGARLRVATSMSVAMGIHVLCWDRGIRTLRVRVLRRAGSCDARVYGNIRVRFHL